ncbi:MAG: serine hydrolase [Pseudomonadota bacterium]
MARVTRRAVLGGLGVTVLAPSHPQQAATQWVDPARMDEAREFARDVTQLHSLTVSIKGERHVAEAFRGASLGTPVNVKSVSKTLLATLVLIAIDKGILTGTRQKVLPLLGDLAPRKMSPQVADITLDHLMSMRSGLVRTSGAAYGDWVSSRDWIGYILRQPVVSRPGTRMSYSTGDFHLLSAALTRASGRSTHALAAEWLGKPLGIDLPPWTRDPRGIYMGGNNMAMSPDGMIRFGEMALAGGLFGEERVISEQMMQAAWTPRARSPFSGHQYGYGWFQTLMSGRRVYYARGYGGQMIYVVPQIETVIAITSDPTLPARYSGHGGVLNRLVGDQILPAIGRA